MRKLATVLAHRVTVAALATLSAISWGQSSPSSVPVPDWYHLANSLQDLSLAGLAGGSANRVWYSPDGGTLHVLTASGKVFETTDFEKWQLSKDAAPGVADLSPDGIVLPEAGA